MKAKDIITPVKDEKYLTQLTSINDKNPQQNTQKF